MIKNGRMEAISQYGDTHILMQFVVIFIHFILLQRFTERSSSKHSVYESKWCPPQRRIEFFYEKRLCLDFFLLAAKENMKRSLVSFFTASPITRYETDTGVY